MPPSPVDSLFGTRDAASRSVYDRLLAALEKIGPFECEFKKTCVHLCRGSAFAGVHPRKGGVLVTIRTAASIESPRVRKAEQVSKNRCHNDVLVSSPGEVDAELVGWLREAHAMSG